MYLSHILCPTVIWLLSACLFCIVITTIIYLLRVRNVVRYRRRADREALDKPEADYLSASVVIYSQGDDAENLHQLLVSILNQDYPAPFEVIVVNEGIQAEVRDTVVLLRNNYPNLYLTYTPEGVVNLSRKKLALTLGIKAARHEVAVLTTTAAEIESPLWLRRMMSRFDREGKTEVVLGYAYIDPSEDTAIGRRHRAFDYVADSIRWLAVAIAGKPFRGTEYNIAYRKDTFMRNKGFARTLNLRYGDDDVFVSEIARGDNTAVELSEESMVRLRQGNHPRIFSERALHQIFTEGFIRRRPRILSTLTGWLQLAALVCGIVAGVFSYPNIVPSIIAAVLVLLMLALDVYIWRNAMRALKSRRLFITLPWLAITYSIRKVLRRLRARIGKHKNYTWD